MKTLLLAAAVLAILTGFGSAHSWTAGTGDKEVLRQHILEEWMQSQKKEATGEIKTANVAAMGSSLNLAAAVIANAESAPAQTKPFQVFPKVALRWDKDYLYIGSNGLPDHPMMIGITAWQQQVPLPQAYLGDNAWRIPLHPTPAKTRAVIEGNFLRGAIALAANGIPIFNPQNNRGEVSYEIGELDEWGGHCGRADDYHYHIAPLKLQDVVGKGMPIAYALDGYPIYGLTEPDGTPVGRLDECHGHEDPKWGYHYHASTKRPYLHSAFHGEIVEVGGQVDPQPRAQPVRPDTPPLRGAVITGFESTGPNSYQLTYKVGSEKHVIRYAIQDRGTYAFEYDNGSEGIVKKTYTLRSGSGGPGGPEGKGRPERKGKGEPGKGKGRGREVMNEEAPRAESPARADVTARNPMDRNEDGSVSGQEFADAAKRAFAACDADKNGSISGDEWLAPNMTGLFAMQMREHAATMDTDGDGVLSLTEVMITARTLFSNSDINRDGKLERIEWTERASGAEFPARAVEMPRRQREDDRPTTAAPSNSDSNGTFVLHSSEVEDGGNLPIDYTGEGSGATLPLTWQGAPAGTKSYALIMDHLTPDEQMKGYWTMWDIPANVTSLPKNVKNIGKVGVGFKGEIGYEPPKSKGPGAKSYVLHLYALSTPPNIKEAPSFVNRDVLLAAIKDNILATADLNVVYTRGASGEAVPPPPKGDKPDAQPRGKGGPDNKGLIKPGIADTIKVSVYADNWFMLYINGKLTVVDSIDFIPHNVVTVDVLPEYPMTIAIMAKDNADPKTGMEYGDRIGDGGFVIKFGDGTVSNASWKAKGFFKGPIAHDTKNPRVEHAAIPENWFAADYDDSTWSQATEYSEQRVNPKEPFYNADFSGAKFIWTEDLDLDNTVLFRTKIERAGWQPRWNTKPDLDVRSAPLK